jgi:hypothetical protein
VDVDGWIQTYTGRKFWPLNPRAQDVCIEDIAWALSHKARFGGHCRAGLYTVAQHSVLVSRHCGPEDALWGLLHDACEAYWPDILSPVKESIRDLAGRPCALDVYEGRIQRAVCQRFGLPARCPPSVKAADVLLLATEARDLMAPLTPGWRRTPENGYAVPPAVIRPWPPAHARAVFLRRFERLMKARAA